MFVENCGSSLGQATGYLRWRENLLYWRGHTQYVLNLLVRCYSFNRCKQRGIDPAFQSTYPPRRGYETLATNRTISAPFPVVPRAVWAANLFYIFNTYIHFRAYSCVKQAAVCFDNKLPRIAGVHGHIVGGRA